MSRKSVKIGGASGYWGDSPIATPQLLSVRGIDYIVYDYLAEITMSLLARAMMKDPAKGYATDFVDNVVAPHITQIADKGIKLISNAGGLNPLACAQAVREQIKAQGLNLKVGVVTGDDLRAKIPEIAKTQPTEMFSGENFPDPSTMASMNAYLGAFPIASALSADADIVITGRCVDSAVTLGVCIHEFGWSRQDYDLLASGSLAGHILECGRQATGGNFTDWKNAGDIASIGYPIATIEPSGKFTVSKPDNTSGLVSVGTVCEQMLYEIGDPQNYELPDVVCDFSSVQCTQTNENEVTVTPARGQAPSASYKVCATVLDGFRTGTMMTFYGEDADLKAQAFGDAVFKSANRTLRSLNAPEFTQTSMEILGSDSQFGKVPGDSTTAHHAHQEVVLKIAARHKTPLEGGILLKEISGLGLASPPGLSGFRAGAPKPMPVVRLFSCLLPKTRIETKIHVEDRAIAYDEPANTHTPHPATVRPTPPAITTKKEPTIEVPLIKLAWGRSGDKGNRANIGLIARDPAIWPWLVHRLDEQFIANAMAHFIDEDDSVQAVTRYLLPGTHSINFLIENVLGGGGIASLRNDPQGKGFAQIILRKTICVPQSIFKKSSRLEKSS